MMPDAKQLLAGTPRSLVGNNRPRRIQFGCWIALIAIAAVRAWFTRYELTPDSMSYLDIARAVAEGHIAAAINSYWSPGYPLLVSPFFRVIHPSPYLEFPLVHGINLLVFTAALAAFHLFWSELLLHSQKRLADRNRQIPQAAFWALGYAAFGIATLNIIGIGLVGPDLLVCAVSLMAASCVMRFRCTPGVGRALLLGLELALGYYIKAPFFPLGFVFIFCACWNKRPSMRMVAFAGFATATFVLSCAPLVFALSVANKRITFGDSARLAQAFYLNGVQYFRHWQGGPPGSGMPVHPTHKLNDLPQIYEFAANNMGTYPPWFAPAYWNAGIRPHIVLKRQAVVFVRNLALEFQIFMESAAPLLLVLIILVLLGRSAVEWTRHFLRFWFVWTPGAAALFMFALIHVEPRFLGGWFVLLYAGGIAACMSDIDPAMRHAIQSIAAAALATVAAILILQSSREAVGIDHADGRSAEDASIAVNLLRSGLHPGDSVAIIGDGTGAYWAHLARLRIIAEIPAASASRPELPARDFWESNPDLQQEALRILARTGAKAVIAGANTSILDAPPVQLPSQWRKVGETRAYVRFFSNP